MVELETNQIESFSKLDNEATELARAEMVEPAGVSHSNHRQTQLVDTNEVLRLVTDIPQFLGWINTKHALVAQNISQVIGEEHTDPTPLSSYEVVIGAGGKPSSWNRYAPTRSDVGNKRLAVFPNLHRKPLADQYTNPPSSEPSGEKLVMVHAGEDGNAQTMHRRTDIGGRRYIDPELVVEYDLDKADEISLKVWLVSKQ